MSSYMNPSKMVTDALSEFLEFDPEQLKMAIWSGNLSLKDVNLRQEAIYPHLNKLLNKNKDTTARNRRPPLHMKILQGTIGELDMKIPWKSLAWGQGDVQVDVRNVVITLALEAREETKKRTNVDLDDPDEKGKEGSELPLHFDRDVKQRMIKEAEKRLLSGRKVTSWLRKSYKEELEKQEKALMGRANLEKSESRMVKWLSGATSGFLWRFYAGLQMKIENLKIVIVQDDIEVGVIMPNIQLLAGSSDKKGPGSHGEKVEILSLGSVDKPTGEVVYESTYEDGEHVDKRVVYKGIGVYVRKLTPPGKSGARGTMTDFDVQTNEFVIRPFDFEFSYSLFFPYPPEKRKKRKQALKAPEANADVSVDGSQPTTASKKRRGKRDKAPPLESDVSEKPKTAASVDRTETTAGTSMPVPAPPVNAVAREQTQTSMSRVKRAVRRASIQQSSFQPISAPPLPQDEASSDDVPSDMFGITTAPAIQQPVKKRHARRSSLAAPLMGSETVATQMAAVSELPPREQIKRQASAPLALPEKINQQYAASTEKEGLTTRFDSRLRVGAVKIVLSTTQYHMLDVFLASTSRMRNGRPALAIGTDFSKVHRTLLYNVAGRPGSYRRGDSTGSKGEILARPVARRLGSFQYDSDLMSPADLRSDTIKNWWYYAYGSVLWELRQQKRLRRLFQDRFLSFSWERQKHRRDEYVELFIATRLEPRSQNEALLTSSVHGEGEAKLVSIEDELFVEQVLLYRMIARTAHSQGMTKMPDSIHEIDFEKTRRRTRHEIQNTGSSSGENPLMQSPLMRTAGQTGFDLQHWVNMPMVLSVAGQRCESSRKRLASPHDELLPPGESFVKFYTMSRRRGVEESTVGMTVDTRVTKVTRKARGGQMDGHSSSSMKFSFAASFSKFEFLLIEDDKRHDKGSDSEVSSVTGSNDKHSEMSSVTIEEHHAVNVDTDIPDKIDDVPSGPVLSSTDFLLFTEPESTLLRLVLTEMNCSALGRSGGSRNLNIKVGSVEGTGYDRCKLLSVGAKIDDDASDANVAVIGDRNTSAFHHNTADAFSFSLILQDEERNIQCDSAHITACADFESLSKILKFSLSSPAQYPSNVLPKSGSEEVMLHVLNQNAATGHFIFLDSSIRVQGFDIVFPNLRELSDDPMTDYIQPEMDLDYGYDENSWGSGKSSVKVEKKGEEGARLRVNMIEFYSGSTVNTLARNANISGKPPSEKTRKLKMLDLEMFEEGNSSLLSYDWIIAVGGVDFEVLHVAVEGEAPRSISFLEAPVEIEVFGTTNAGSVRDFTRAKREVIVEVSELDFKVSESRLRLLSKAVPEEAIMTDRQLSTDKLCQPRLDVLSRSLLYVVDVSFSRVRASLVTDEGMGGMGVLSRYTQFEQFISDFLNVVKDFDFRFPNGEALSAGMQICIDRLAGIGFGTEEGWHCANTALLHFLEGMESAQMAATVDDGGDITEEQMKLALSKTTDDFRHKLKEQYQGRGSTQHHVVFDMPNGCALSCVKLYYDFHCMMNFPTAFVTNGEGIHILRLTPEVNEDEEGEDARPLDDADSDALLDKASEPGTSSRGAATVRMFQVDKGSLFGKGGQSLTILGEEGSFAKRTVESLVDVEVGDIEILFCQDVFVELLDTLSDCVAPLFACIPKVKKTSSGSIAKSDSLQKRSLYSVTAFSALFSSDRFVPFCRLNLNDCMWTLSSGIEEEKVGSKGSAKSMAMLNLTSDGQLYPEPISVLPSAFGLPFLIEVIGEEGYSNIHLRFRAVRILFLRQFLNECLQFFYYTDYGVGLFRTRMKEIVESAGRKSTNNGTSRIWLHFFDCSVIMPRHNESSDMVAIEVSEASVGSCRLNRSFIMPTDAEMMDVGPLPSEDMQVDSQSPTSPNPSPCSRTYVSLRDFRIYTSTPDPSVNHDTGLSDESPAFGFFFGIDGRAENLKPVYAQLPSLGAETAEEEERWTRSEKAKRRWDEATCNSTSLDIIVDYAPYMRLLLSDPLDVQGNRVALDLTLSQFCLLLTVWYGNMQQLPVLFPYNSRIFELNSRSLAVLERFPSYGTPELLEILSNTPGTTSETATAFNDMSLCCREDESQKPNGPAVTLAFGGATVHIINDSSGVTRLGAGALTCSMTDTSKIFSQVIAVRNHSQRSFSFADLTYGVQEKVSHLASDLPLGFQLSLVMGPEWTTYNLGMQCPQLIMSDFTTIFSFLHFVAAYFGDESYGNPSFGALQRVGKIKEELMHAARKDEASTEDPISVLDFRCWLRKPTLKIPCSPNTADSDFTVVESKEGLWYRFSSVDVFSSQEVVGQQMNLSFEEDVELDPKKMKSDSAVIIEGLSFGLRINYHGLGDHYDVSLQIPYAEKESCGYTDPGLFVEPGVVARPTVCVPRTIPDRHLGPDVCELTCIIDVLPRAWSALYGLFNADVEEMEDPSSNHSEESGSVVEEDGTSQAEEGSTMSFTANLGDMRVFVLDPKLGPHLPVTVFNLGKTSITTSAFANPLDLVRTPRNQAPLHDLQVLLEGDIWADYFKFGLTRSWEPLLEAYSFSLLFERSRLRGVGVTLSSNVPFHVNVSGAFLSILDECYDAFRSIFQKVTEEEKATRHHRRMSTQNRPGIEYSEDFDTMSIIHRRPAPLQETDRVAFSLKNMTGQMIRTFRIGGSSLTAESRSVVNYLDNSEAIKLSLLPSVSLIKNLGIVEVQYPGLENSPRSSFDDEIGTSHQLDLQIPGFAWIRNLKIDQFGRRFIDLIPRSAVIRSKLRQDWRLANIMKLLVEVGLERGGREVAVRSMFSVQNMTTHVLKIRLNADAYDRSSETDGTDDLSIDPSESFPIPLVLIENALRLTGSHLGSFWLRPDISTVDDVFTSENFDTKDLLIKMSTKPVQLAKLAGESSSIFANQKGDEAILADATSGVTLSCPVVGSSDEKEVAPFCYALEIVRSPMVPVQQPGGTRKGRREKQHGPVAYTINVHAPIVLVNLLPERGRFEIMHAVRRTVLWFADLEPGQQVPVHSVGLDAPLTLYIKLRFCCTPVDEGALIHHGTVVSHENKESLVGLKSIGKAGKAVTKQLGKTLTSLSETPDKRSQMRMQQPKKDVASVISRSAQSVVESNPLGLDGVASGVAEVGGQTFRVDTAAFLPSDCVSETVVVDRIGQKLTLQIENIEGGGGQRRISVSSPFWIVNCTEHSLRYKQENYSGFVCGTVTDRERDGSVPIDSGTASWIDATKKTRDPHEPLNRGTIFSGTPGALATSVGRCFLPPEEVAAVIDKNMPLEKMASLAFMFNFSEGALSMGGQKLCLQLHDGTGQTKYQSEWSRGFSLSSVGFSQVVELQCAEGRALELIVVVHTAPGSLSGYTKVVRILPRYVAVNHLPYPVRLWQDNSSFRPPVGEATNNAETTGSGKWRNVPSRTGKSDYKKVNQYESLWGREVNIAFDETGGHVPQGTSARETALYIATLSSSSWRPFNLPDSRGDRQIRVGQGAAWNLSSSVSADIPGEHTLRVSRATDIRLLKHVSTRASPQYTVTLPPPGESSFDDELGVWFETEWGSDRSLLVKAIKQGSYCFNKTDLRVGDELLAIDDVPVSRLSFAEAMDRLRNRLAEIKSLTQAETKQASRRKLRFGSRAMSKQDLEADAGNLGTARSLTLTFRTSEERLRRVRRKAAKSGGGGALENRNSQHDQQQLDERIDDARFLNVELRPIHNMTFVHLAESSTVPYGIQNRSKSTTIYYRQKGCSAHPWRSLKPGASEVYTWEEPLKSKRLSLRVSLSDEFSVSNDEQPTSSRLSVGGRGSQVSNDKQKSSGKVVPHLSRKPKQNRKVRDEEDSNFSPSVNIRLDEIGYHEVLQLNGSNDTASNQNGLAMEVGVIGSTRVLAVQDISKDDSESLLLRHLEALEARALEEERRLVELRSLAYAYKESRSSPDSPASVDSENELVREMKNLTQEFPEERTIHAKHQLVVEVLEAVGLSPDSYIGVCNPYVEISLNSDGTGRRSLFRRDPAARRTYFVRKSVNPTWNNQTFVFNVPEEAVSVTRGHSLRIKIRNFRKIGAHTTLGRAQVDLHSLRNQKPLTGWFPLVGRTGRRELENSTSYWGRGSIRLNVHWVFTTSALLDYCVLLTETRLANLLDSVEGMQEQLERKREEELKQMEHTDGFRAVRLNDSSPKRHAALSANERRESVARESTGVRRIFQPVLSRARDSIARVSVGLPSSQLRRSKDQDRLPPNLSGYGRKRQSNESSAASAAGGQLESKIAKLRHELRDKVLHQMQNRKRERALRNYVASGSFPLSSFKTWVDAQKLVNDKDFVVKVEKNAIQVKLNLSSRRKQILDNAFSSRENPRIDSIIIPPLYSLNAHKRSIEYAEKFCDSRRNFDRLVRCALRVTVNPGGWLIIRPIQAKNLPDSSSGMSVKVQYDMKSQTSDTVDSTVFPTWFKGLNRAADSPRVDAAETLPGDLCFKIPPQQTNSYLRLSVIAEGRHQGIVTRTEVGVLHIPLGGAIAACVNAVEDFQITGKTQEGADSPVYIRWFPLKKPQDEIPAEGDQLVGRQSTDTEKIESDQFTEYFTPCIQLGLLWSPEVERDDDTGDDEIAGGVFSSPVKRYINADFSQISCALIDSRRSTELLSCTLTDIDVRHWVTKAKSRYGLSLGWFQFDQQNESARDAVVLCPTQKGVLTPVFQMLAAKDNMRSKTDVLSFEFIDVSIAEFDVSVEERFLFQLYDFFAALRLRAKTKIKDEQQKKKTGTGLALLDEENDEPDLFSAVSELSSAERTDRRVYIQQLCLGVLKFNISYFKGKKESKKKSYQIDEWTIVPGAKPPAAVEQSDSDAFRRWSQNTFHDEEVVDYLGKRGSSLPSLIASLFPNISDAPVRLQAKALNHVFYSPTEILVFIMGFYQTEILRQIYKIIGSLDFVGNPTMVLNSFISGFRDLIVTPSVALIDSPTDVSKVGMGVAKGTLSLFSHSTSGFFGFASKVSAGAGQGLASLSLDKEYRRWHREAVLAEASSLDRTWKRRGLQNAGQMIVRPVADITMGVASGVAGLLVAPAKGLKKGGGKGLARGVASGVAGVVVKPTVGVLDALSHFTGSVHDIAKSVNVLEKRVQPTIRYRLPYVFGAYNILIPYTDDSARATRLLKMFPPKKRLGIKGRSEFVVHVEVLSNLGIDTYGIVTNLRLLLLRVKKEQSGTLIPSICWQVALVGESNIVSQVSEHGHNGVALTINVNKPAKVIESESVLVDDAGPISVTMHDPIGLEDVSEVGNELDHGHGTSRGKEGELLEWFTIVAEYQHRRQIFRLHNAVSSLTGNLDAVIRDKPLGRKGSTEGYTSFGIFHFDNKDRDCLGNAPGTQDSLESLPWYQAHMTSGPDWLRKAQEVACSTADLDTDVIIAGTPEEVAPAPTTEGRRTGRRLTKWLVGRLPTIQDAENDPRASFETPVKFVTTTSLHGSDDGIIDELDLNEETFEDQKGQEEEEEEEGQEEEETTALAPCPNREVTRGNSSGDESSDFQSAVSFEEPNSSAEPPRERRRGMRRFQFLSTRSFGDSPFRPRELQLDGRGSAHTTTAASMGGSTRGEYSDSRARLPQERLDRMEGLMEQLLIVTSENALQVRASASLAGTASMAAPPVQTAGSVDGGTTTASLDATVRDEIQELRRQLREQSARDAARVHQADVEIASLRAELSQLRNQVMAHQSIGSASVISSLPGSMTTTTHVEENEGVAQVPEEIVEEGDEESLQDSAVFADALMDLSE